MKIIVSIAAAAAIAFASGTALAQPRTDLVLGVVLEPPHLDPTAGAAAAIDEIVYANVFEGLTRIGPNGEVLPALAESWEISEDGLTYTFALHEGVTFHDGAPFTADDVVFSLDRARADDSTNAQKGLFAAIKSVEATDPATVTVTLSHPQGAFLYNMGWGDAVIVSEASAATNAENPVGTGPFRFDSWARGSSIVLVKSPDYWGEEVALDRAEFRIVPDAAAAVPAILSGDIQAFPMFPPDAYEQVQGDPRFKVVIGSTEGETILAMNNGKEPFDNIEVRRAISYAVNRDEVIAGASNGLGTPIGSHFSPANAAYVDLTGTYPFDPERAKELLAEAGLADGFSATLKLPPPGYARQGGEIIAAQLRQIGINLEIQPVEWADWLSTVFTDKDYDLTIISHTEPNDIDIYSRPDYYFNYQNEAFNEVIAELDQTSDEAQRNELYGQAQEILAEDAPVVFLFQLPKVGVWDAKLEGLWENMPVQANDLTKVRWTE
ncbi:ABC transporter substrate-binding protein [Aliihoeflea sp. PC F10.4]